MTPLFLGGNSQTHLFLFVVKFFVSWKFNKFKQTPKHLQNIYKRIVRNAYNIELLYKYRKRSHKFCKLELKCL